MKKILCFFLWGVFALLSMDSAFAYGGFSATRFSDGAQFKNLDTADAACAAARSDAVAYMSNGTRWNPATFPYGSANSGGGCYPPTGSSVANWGYALVTCTAPATRNSTGVCACPTSGDNYTHGTGCVAPPPKCPAAGTDGPTLDWAAGWRTGPDANAAWASPPVMPPSGGCYNGCTVSLYMSQEWIGAKGPNGYYQGGFNLTSMHTGAECTGQNVTSPTVAEPTVPPPEENRCPRGTSQIGIDSAGIPICKGNAPVPEPTKTTQTTSGTDSQGRPTSTTTETTTNADGSTTTKTTTTTTNPDGSTTTTSNTTTTNASNGAPGQSDDDVPEFCKSNPNLSVCKNSQISGQCESVSCDGDAIQCAIAKEIAKRNCEQRADEKALKDSAGYATGTAAAAGTLPGLPTPANATTFNVQSSLDQSGWLGGGACFPDKSFVIQGRTITIPFSDACDYLIVFRYAIMILAGLVAFRMLSGTFLKE